MVTSTTDQPFRRSPWRLLGQTLCAACGVVDRNVYRCTHCDAWVCIACLRRHWAGRSTRPGEWLQCRPGRACRAAR
jgi:hypothetical protein